MLEVAVAALIISLIAGALGYTDVAEGTAKIAKGTFGCMLLLAIILLIMIALGITLVD